MAFGLGSIVGGLVGQAVHPAGGLIGAGIGSAFDSDGGGGGGGGGWARPRYSVDMGQLRQQFVKVLGREPSQVEKDYFSRYLQDGSLSMYEVGEILSGSPEAQQARIPQQAQQLQQYLTPLDEEQLRRSGDLLQQRFASQNRAITGSGYTQAYMNAARDLALARQGQMANLVGQGLSGINQAYAQQAQQSRSRGRGLEDVYRQREFDLADYYQQKSDYDNYLNQAQRLAKEQAWIQGGIGLGTSLLGAGAGMLGGLPASAATRTVTPSTPGYGGGESMYDVYSRPRTPGSFGGKLQLGNYGF